MRRLKLKVTILDCARIVGLLGRTTIQRTSACLTSPC